MNPMINQRYYKYRREKTVSKSIVNSAVEEILSVARLELKRPLKELTVLDVGCGSGEYSFALEKYVKKVVGVEPYGPIYECALVNKRKLKSRVLFFNKPIEEFSSDEKFDLVVSLTTLEHMPNAEKSFQRIFSLMKKGGIIYLTAPNKLWPIESHYKLPFLSWLPLPIANFYVRIAGKADSYEDCSYSKTYFGVRRFFNKFPCGCKFVLPQNPNSSFIGSNTRSSFYQVIKKVGIALIKRHPFFWIFSKGFIMVVRKI